MGGGVFEVGRASRAGRARGRGTRGALGHVVRGDWAFGDGGGVAGATFLRKHLQGWCFVGYTVVVV